MPKQDRECTGCGKQLFDQDPDELTNLCDECLEEEKNVEELSIDL